MTKQAGALQGRRFGAADGAPLSFEISPEHHDLIVTVEDCGGVQAYLSPDDLQEIFQALSDHDLIQVAKNDEQSMRYINDLRDEINIERASKEDYRNKYCQLQSQGFKVESDRLSVITAHRAELKTLTDEYELIILAQREKIAELELEVSRWKPEPKRVIDASSEEW